MTIEAAARLMISSLSDLYDEREASSITSLVMERLTGMSRSVRVLKKWEVLTENQSVIFSQYLADLSKYKPVQYVLSEAWFGSYSFYVDENVLIPRPETEELVNWLLSDYPNAASPISLLDIGTGSGIIPVIIKKNRKHFNLYALDKSQNALSVAEKNANAHQAAIQFLHYDILDSHLWQNIPATDLIISNPPYIPEKQRVQMEKNVVSYEPGLALFVPDEDPILFYRTIGQFAQLKLKPGGTVFLEIHHDYAREVIDWYKQHGFELELRKDFSGNDRMIKATIV